MPDPMLRLDPPRLTVQPGGQARTVLTISNTGPIVEGFRVEVLGEGPPDWAEVSTSEVAVYPAQAAQVVVTLSPPAGTGSRSGSVPFAVRAVSVVGEAAAVAEGDLEIGRVAGLQGRITPVNSSARWSARHRLEVTNGGNAPVRLHLVATDPDERLGFLLQPQVLDLPPGGSAVARLKVRTRAPFLRGTVARLPFQVLGGPAEEGAAAPGRLPDPDRVVVDGALNQRPILSRGTVAAAGLAAIALVAVGALALRAGGGAPAPKLQEGEVPTPTVTDLTMTSTSAVLRWKPLDDVDKVKVLTYTDTGGTPDPVMVDGQKQDATVRGLRPQTHYCFSVTSFHGKQPSVESGPKCQDTPARDVPSPSGTPTADPSGGGGGSRPLTATPTDTRSGPSDAPNLPPEQWLGFYQLRAADDAVDPDADVAAARATGFRAGRLNSIYFPNLGLQKETIVVYLGPFETREAAAAACSAAPCHDTGLQPKQPGLAVTPTPAPAGSPTAVPSAGPS